MNILWLGPERPELFRYFESLGETLTRWEEPLTSESPVLDGQDWLISYGYRHILKTDVLKRFGNRAINLHISLLPWNRGADPNLWSFLEATPKGVTIHVLDEGVDTGAIIAQREVDFSELKNPTLKTTYETLSKTIEDLLIESWMAIRDGKITPQPQPENKGSLHRMRDKSPYEALLTQGWDTPVAALSGKALKQEALKP